MALYGARFDGTNYTYIMQPQKKTSKANELLMTVLSKTLFRPLWVERDLSLMGEFCSENISVHTTFYTGEGISDVRKSFEILFKAFPVFDLQVDDSTEYCGRITYKWHADAIHYQSSKQLKFNGVAFLVFNTEGHITQYHSFSNMPQIMQNAGIDVNNSIEKYENEIEHVEQQWSNLLFIVAKNTHINLTYRELECLYYWVNGYTIKDTARQLGGLSGKTIQAFRNNITKKFETKSFHELIKLLHKAKILTKLLDAKH